MQTEPYRPVGAYTAARASERIGSMSRSVISRFSPRTQLGPHNNNIQYFTVTTQSYPACVRVSAIKWQAQCNTPSWPEHTEHGLRHKHHNQGAEGVYRRA